jgi:hypothetical protein
MSNIWKKVMLFTLKEYAGFRPNLIGKIIEETESWVLIRHHIFLSTFAFKEKSKANFSIGYIEYTITK